MADATLARSDTASRDEELRLKLRRATPILALTEMISRLDDAFAEAERKARSLGGNAARAIHDVTLKAFSDSLYPMFDMIPETDRDLVILAGFTSMMADRLDEIAQADDEAQRLAKGIKGALITIAGILSTNDTRSGDDIRSLWPELGRSIQRDVMATEIRRADMEALRHG